MKAGKRAGFLILFMGLQFALQAKSVNTGVVFPQSQDLQPATQDTRRISGQVQDETGLPLPGVNVVEKDRPNGTITDGAGEFTIEVAGPDATLVFSSVGYVSQEIRVGEQTRITISLALDKVELEELVVVAYGTKKRSAITGAVAEIDPKDIEKRPLTNIADAIAGSAPGIMTTLGSGQPGGGAGIRVRGFGSVSAGSTPLIVVDGTVYDGDLSSIDPGDIASVNTLMDAASAALYGSRGSNGVILITTRGGQKDKTDIKLHIIHGFNERMLPEYDRVSTLDYYPIMWEYYKNGLVSSGVRGAAKAASDSIKSMLGYNPFNVPDRQIVGIDGRLNPNARLLYPEDLDWEKAATRKGYRQSYQLSIGSGQKLTTYYASIGYTNEKGYTKDSDYKRLNARFKVNTRIAERVKIGTNLNAALQKANSTPAIGSGFPVNPFYFARFVGPIYPVHEHDKEGNYVLDANNNKVYDRGIHDDGDRPFSASRHVIDENSRNKNYSEGNTLSSRTSLDVNIYKGLSFRSTYGIDYELTHSYAHLNPVVGDGAPSGSLEKSNNVVQSSTFNQLFNYNFSLSHDHEFDVMVAHESYDRKVSSQSTQVRSLVFDDNPLELSNYSQLVSSASNTIQKRIESFFGQVNYNYQNKVFVTTSFRRDGNSIFAAANRWSNFWSAALAWHISREEFYKKNAYFLSDLSLKVSYGKVGNDKVGSYPFFSGFSTHNNANEQGMIFTDYGAKDLTWESLHNLTLGVNFTLFKDRITGYVQWYNKTSSGLVFAVPLAPSVGGTSGGSFSQYQNVGSMYNRGIEISLKGLVLAKKDFGWNTQLDLYTLKNRITKMPADNPEIISGTKKLAVGRSFYEYFLTEYRGVDVATGDPLYTLNPELEYNENFPYLTPDKTISGERFTTYATRGQRTYKGTAIPDLYGNLRNTLYYKNIFLETLFSFQLGGYVYDRVYANLMTPSFGRAVHKDIKRRWRQSGDITDVPRLDHAYVTAFNGQTSQWLTSASCLTIKSVQLSYQLQSKYLKYAKIAGARLYISVENVYQFSARKGMNVLEYFSGVTSDSYVPRRNYSIGAIFNL